MTNIYADTCLTSGTQMRSSYGYSDVGPLIKQTIPGSGKEAPKMAELWKKTNFCPNE